MLGPMFRKGEWQIGQHKAGLNAIIMRMCLRYGLILLDVAPWTTDEREKDRISLCATLLYSTDNNIFLN
jgi:hypothetical protein